LALAVERGDIAPLPIGLITGTLYAGGLRPPVPARAVADGLQALVASDGAIDDGWLADCFWPLSLPGACEVLGDRDQFERGERTTLHLRARVEHEDSRRPSPSSTLVITALPYGVNPDDLVQRLATMVRHRRIPDGFPELAGLLASTIVDLRDASTARTGMRIEVDVLDGHEAEKAIRAVWGVELDLEVELPLGPAMALRQHWAATRGEDLAGAVAALRSATRH
jgi:hypothetical protein